MYYSYNDSVKAAQIRETLRYILKWGAIIGLIVTLSAIACLYLIEKDLQREMTSCTFDSATC